MRTQRAFARGIAGALLLTVTSLSVMSAASADTNGITASKIASAINNTDAKSGDLVAESVPSKTSIGSAAVVQQDGFTTSIPQNPEDGIGLAGKDGWGVTIGLPNANEANDAERLSDGTVVYSATNGSANAAVATGDGVQVLNTITNQGAPTRYDYKVSVPEGGKIEILNGGSARIVDANGNDVLYVGAPWAKDANGIDIPTHFEVDGTKLIQFVGHNNENVKYPVVADPRFYYSWGIVTVKFNSAETGYLSRAGGAAIGAYLGGPGAAFFTALGGDWLADVAAAHGKCLVYRIVPWYIWAGGLWIENC